MLCSRCQQEKPCPASDSATGDMFCLDCMTGGVGSKYGNNPTEYNGRRYDSQAEAERAAELDLLLEAGEIHKWVAQPRYVLGDLAKINFTADFAVWNADGTVHVEDVKGYETERFRLIRQLWRAMGPAPLVILKRQGSGWRKQIIWPLDVDQSKYQLDKLVA